MLNVSNVRSKLLGKRSGKMNKWLGTERASEKEYNVYFLLNDESMFLNDKIDKLSPRHPRSYGSWVKKLIAQYRKKYG